MHYPEPTLPSARTKGRYSLDTLDWLAAIFVIATPVFIVYQLVCN